ncbi:MAG: hypothetical protein RLZZ367_1462, partial [Bacteroidota bacterium]
MHAVFNHLKTYRNIFALYLLTQKQA